MALVFSQRKPDEELFLVEKRNFTAVCRFSFDSHKRGHLLTGSTGSGKSTYALLPVLKSGRRVLLVQPTHSNVGNTVLEFATRMPAVVAKHYPEYAGYPMPVVVSQATDSDKFVVCTVEQLGGMMRSPMRLKEFACIILDEYHQQSQPMYDALAFLRTASEYVSKYILISATPGADDTEPTYGSDVHVSRVAFPLELLDASSQSLVTSVYNPKHYLGRGNGCVAIVMPNEVYVERYYQLCVEAGVTVHVVDAQTSHSRYVEVQRCVGLAPCVVVLDPAVEAGITIQMSTLINPGYTYMVKYDGSVVYPVYRSLSTAETKQRAGRAGRGIFTHYIENTATPHEEPGEPGGYLMANTAVRMIALGLDASWLPESVKSRYTRLQKLTVNHAKAALRDQDLDPVVAVYKYDNDGQRYKESGGKAKSFFEDCGRDLRVFYYTSGYCILPVFTLVNKGFDPTLLIKEKQQKKVLSKVLDLHKDALGELSLQKRVELLRANMSVFHGDFFSNFEKVFNVSEPMSYTSRTGDVTLSMMFDEMDLPLSTLFEALGSVEGYVLGSDFTRRGGKMSRAFYVLKDGVRKNLSPKAEFHDGPYLLVEKVARALVDAQIEAINIAALSSVAGMSVNLEKYAKFSTPSHVWYHSNVVRNMAKRGGGVTTVGESVVVYGDDAQAQQDQQSDSETEAEATSVDEDDKETDRTEPDTEPLPGGGSEEFDDGSEEEETPTS